MDQCERRPSLQERVESELGSFAVLLTERLADFSTWSEMKRLKVDRLESVGSEENLGLTDVALGSASGEEARS